MVKNSQPTSKNIVGGRSSEKFFIIENLPIPPETAGPAVGGSGVRPVPNKNTV